jgi:HprK-related kinase A
MPAPSFPSGLWPETKDIYLRTGPFTTHLRTAIASLIDEIHALYAPEQITPAVEFADFHIKVDAPFLRRWYRPKARFVFDGERPFQPLPIDQALPIFEWGLNWCVATYAHQFLVLHAAVIAKGERAVIMPGAPGAGKSTLTAGLVSRGWRLLSDELTLISPATGLISGMGRPISLKNQSIEVIRGFVPSARISREAHDTGKGRVALLKAPSASVAQLGQQARAEWIIFPKYLSGSPAALERRPKAPTMFSFLNNCFNYGLHGRQGFDALASVVDACQCYHFTYADLNEAVAIFDRLAAPA